MRIKIIFSIISFFGLGFLFFGTVQHVYADTFKGEVTTCQADPKNPSPGTDVHLKLQTQDPYILVSSQFNVYSVKAPTGKKFTPKDLKETSKSTSHLIDLGSFQDVGAYDVDVEFTAATPKNGTVSSECYLPAAFSIGSGNPDKAATVITSPTAPITQNDLKMIDKITITSPAIVPGTVYSVKLGSAWNNWNNTDYLRYNTNPNDGKDFTAVPCSGQSSGSQCGAIVDTNVCDDGSGGHDPNNTDTSNKKTSQCTDNFPSRTYAVTVFDQSEKNAVTDTATFDVTAADTVKTSAPPIPAPCDTSTGANGQVQITCNTALGSIPATPADFVNKLLQVGIAVGGVIALLLIVYGGFRIATSNGDAEAVKNGRVIITSAIAGLIFILASVFLLNFLGGNILGIPSFNGTLTTSNNATGGLTPQSLAADLATCSNQQDYSTYNTTNNVTAAEGMCLLQFELDPKIQTCSQQANAANANKSGNAYHDGVGTAILTCVNAAIANGN